jgi:hypothetical protein
MRKTHLFAIAAAFIVAGVAGWAAPTTNARVAPSTGPGIEPLQLMMNATQLPAQHFDDYSVIFN